jgi:hypothetical protein
MLTLMGLIVRRSWRREGRRTKGRWMRRRTRRRTRRRMRSIIIPPMRRMRTRRNGWRKAQPLAPAAAATVTQTVTTTNL